MAETIQKHVWADIGNAPEVSGVYAWYYSPEITDFDLDSTVNAVRSAPERTEAERAIRSVLDSRLFHHFREEPYTASISGPLILGDFVAMTGVHRKHAIRMLTTTGVGSQPRGGPNPNWRHGATVAG